MSIVTKSTGVDRKETPGVDLVDKKNIHWSLPSASGRFLLDCRFVGASEIEGALVFSLFLEGDFWKRGEKDVAKEIVKDFSILLPQVIISMAAITDLKKKFEEWMCQRKEFSLEISQKNYGDQKLVIEIGRHAELIYSRDKPACVISYKCGSSMSGCWPFIVDQSCVGICVEEINAFLILL